MRLFNLTLLITCVVNSFTLTSCYQTSESDGKGQALIEKEIELLKKENELLKKRTSVKPKIGKENKQ